MMALKAWANLPHVSTSGRRDLRGIPSNGSFGDDVGHTDNMVVYAWYGHSGLPGMAGRGMR